MEPNIKCAHTAIVNVTELKPHPSNENKHPQKQIEALAKIIANVGQRSPIVVSARSGFISKGHGRLEAIKMLGWTTVAVDVQQYETELQELQDRVADNEIARYAEFQMEQFQLNLKPLGLSMSTIDLPLFGILEPFKQTEPPPDENIPEKPPVPIVRAGELWQLGAHRLLCGDSASHADVTKLMNGKFADAVFTSPPYNVGISYNGYDDTKPSDEYFQLMDAILRNCHEVMDNGRMIAWNIGVSPKSKPHHHGLLLESVGFQFYRQIVWKKCGANIPLWQNSKAKPNARYYLPNFQHELIYMATKGDIQTGAETVMPDALSMDVWDVSQFSAGGNNHPAAFPVHLAEMAIQVMTAPNEIAFEPFGGSGSTLIACQKQNRVCHAMEIDPHYCDVIIERWQKFTGNSATLDGETYFNIKTQRVE